MGKISLQIKASLENITDLKPDGEDFRWYLKLKCTSCGEGAERWQYVNLMETVPLKGGRGEAHLVIKCKLCGRENSLSILENSVNSYSKDDNTFADFVVFECRGLEPTDYSPRIGFKAKGSDSGTLFKDINLEEKEWVDYDEKAAVSVGIYEFEHRFRKV